MATDSPPLMAPVSPEVIAAIPYDVLAAVHPALPKIPPAALAVVAGLPPAVILAMPPAVLSAIHPALTTVPPAVLAALPHTVVAAVPSLANGRSMQYHEPGNMRVTGRGVYLDPQMIHDIATAIAQKLAQDGVLNENLGQGRNHRMEIVFMPK